MKPFNQLTDEERKALPVDKVVEFFPNALAAAASQISIGTAKYGPDEAVRWHRGKSRDELGSRSRHLLDYSLAWNRDYYEGMAEAVKADVWRSLAHAERFFGTTDEDPEYYQDIRRLREESQDLAEASEFTEEDLPEPYRLCPSWGEWSFIKPQHGETYLTYTVDGHGPEKELHRGVDMVGPELEGYRWVRR